MTSSPKHINHELSPMACPVRLGDVDLFGDGAAEHWYEAYEILHREAPVLRIEGGGVTPGTDAFVLTKHADVKAVSHDSATFSSELGGTFIPTADEEALANLRITILMMDPPKHHRYRRLVSKGFTPRMITSLVEEIERRAAKVIDEVEI